MNLYRTTLFFALLLTTLWIFGLMTAYKRLVPDETRIAPTLESQDAKVEAIVIKKKQGKDTEETNLVRDKDTWYLKSGEQKIKLENFKVDGLVNQAKRAQKSEAFPGSDDLGRYGLAPPETTVLLKGTLKGQPKEWQLNFGNESADKTLIYANSSDRPDKAFGVSRDGVDSIFKDPSSLRPRRLFDFTEAQANHVDLRKGSNEVELKRGEDTTWRFEKPALGFAGFDVAAPTAVGGDPAKKEGGGVKGLLGAISGLHVDNDDDFVSPGQPLARFDLDEGKESMRIEVGTAGSGDKKEGARETLLVGKKTPQGDQYYARLLGDDGVVKLAAKQFDEVDKTLKRPGEIRSRDVAAFDPKNVDVVVLRDGDTSVKLTKGDGDDWKIHADGTTRKGNAKALQALVDALQGKNAISRFDDPAESEQKKFDEQWGLDKATAAATVYAGGLDKEKKDELKKDAKPSVTLDFGKTEDDAIHVKRTLADGTVSRFTVPKSILELVKPEEGAVLAYLDPALPAPGAADVIEIELRRGKEKQDLVRQEGHWYVKDPQEPSGLRLADAGRVDSLLQAIDKLQAKKWITWLGGKTDLDRYGLKSSDLEVTLLARRDRISSWGAASMIAELGAAGEPAVLAALATAAVPRRETTTVRFGKENEKTHDVYATHTGRDAVFTTGVDVVKLAREGDLRDRSVILNTQPALVAGVLAAGDWIAAAPLVNPEIANLDPAQVKEIKIALRKPEELRVLTFRRADKTWQDQSGLQEFQLDPERVNQIVTKLARLPAERMVSLGGGPRAEHKLGPKDAALSVLLTTESGRTVTLRVGSEFERAGYFMHSSSWPDVVFLVSPETVEPLLQRGVGYFSKERVAAAR